MVSSTLDFLHQLCKTDCSLCSRLNELVWSWGVKAWKYFLNRNKNLYQIEKNLKSCQNILNDRRIFCYGITSFKYNPSVLFKKIPTYIPDNFHDH